MTGSPASVFTIGYEGRQIGDFVEHLTANGIEVLVDVREMPVSRKPGFSKSKLSEAVQEAGLRYLHLKSLGSPRDIRHRLRAHGDFDTFSKEYISYLDRCTEDVASLWELIDSGERAALMCFERDHEQCHRTLLINRLSEVADGHLDTYHL